MPKHRKSGTQKSPPKTGERSAIEEILFDKHEGSEETEGDDRGDDARQWPLHHIRRNNSSSHGSGSD